MSETEKLMDFIENHCYTHLIFDLDETLSWLKLPWNEGYEVLCQRASSTVEPLMRKKLRQKAGYSQIVNPAIRTDESFLPIAIDWAVQFEAQLVEHVPHFELVSQIPTLAKKHTILLWSSNTHGAIEKVLADLDILNYFTRIIGREDVKYIKPMADGWSYFANDNIPVKQYLFIGDSENDKGAAEQIGLDYFEIKHFKQSKDNLNVSRKV